MHATRFPLIFLPYFFIYLFFWKTYYSLAVLEAMFSILHAVVALGIFILAWRHRRQFVWADVAFWGGLAGVFFLCGAYLEFPSDPWEHYNRTVTWNGLELIDHHGTRQRFIYYWNWTWIKLASPQWRSVVFDALSTFWQLVLWGSGYAFLRRLGFSAGFARLQVLSGVLFFGTSIFSFRYYALAGTPLAYALYFTGLACLVDALQKSKKALLWLPLVCVGIFYSHPQEMAFLLIAAIALPMAIFLRNRRRWSYGLAAAGIFLTLIAVLAPTFWETWRYAVSAHGRPFLTLAVPGIVGFVYAWSLFRTQPIFALLSVLPPLLLLWPPSLLLMVGFTGHISDIYRLLYAFPTAFSFALALERLCRYWRARSSVQWAGLLTVLLSLPLFYPWLGRGFSQLYSPRFLELRWIAATETEMRSLGGPHPFCQLETDPVSQFALQPWLREFKFQEQRNLRQNPISELFELNDRSSLDRFIRDRKVCAILVADPRQLPPIPWSLLGHYSSHWFTHYVSVALTPPPSLLPLLEELSQTGWEKRHVSPFYILWLRRE